jgi:hypothetical protein
VTCKVFYTVVAFRFVVKKLLAFNPKSRIHYFRVDVFVRLAF